MGELTQRKGLDSHSLCPLLCIMSLEMYYFKRAGKKYSTLFIQFRCLKGGKRALYQLGYLQHNRPEPLQEEGEICICETFYIEKNYYTYKINLAKRKDQTIFLCEMLFSTQESGKICKHVQFSYNDNMPHSILSIPLPSKTY